MRFSRHFDLKPQLNRKERLQGTLLLVLMIAVVLCGMYLGFWLLQREEQNDPTPQFNSAGFMAVG